MRSLERVNSYFEREAGRFDAIYERDKPARQRLGDWLFRRVILERYSLVVNAIGAPGSSVLDVGCGPGRYGIELARRGARRCVGVDVAAAMLGIAREARRPWRAAAVDRLRFPLLPGRRPSTRRLWAT
jgi:ubiquinone/menaquinone biosynthesis C-methylase UbiE